MKKLIAAMLLIFSFNVQADLLDNALNYVKESEYSVLYAYKSKHWFTQDYTNDTHHMVGLRINNIVVGRFKNSYDRETFFLGFYGELNLTENWHVLGAIGAMKGYTSCFGNEGEDARWCAMVAGGVSYSGFSEYIQPAIFQLGDATNIGFKSDF